MKKFFTLGILVFLFLLSACSDKKRYHDKTSVVDKSAYPSEIVSVMEFQEKLNKTFKDPNASPLPDRYRKDFEGLEFFSPDTNYIVEGILKRVPEPIPFLMPTNTERKSEESVFGVIEFTLKDQKYALEVYQNVTLKDSTGYKDYLFLPFMDKTNGRETYEGGRYIDLTIPEGDRIMLNFNLAYNPYCVYNKKYSCPLVPAVNYLDTEIRAGVKAFNKK